MRKTIIPTILLIIFSFLPAEAQDRDVDVRAGLGISNIRKERNFFLLSEYELNVKWTDYLTVAPSIVLNHGTSTDPNDLINFYQANLNAFVSPFRNNRKNDFRMGAGLSFYRLNRGNFYATRSAFGLNFIIEESYMVNDRFFIGVKAFVQPYFDKDLDSGILLKAGINL